VCWSKSVPIGDHDRETVIGLTATGRAKIVTLDLNSEFRKEARRLWFQTGWLPFAK
jgi:hypothetical protein